MEKYWFINFERLRDTLIPKITSADKGTRELSLEDDEFLAEDVNAIYDEKLGILMLQRNKYSLGSRGIESYINEVWGNRNNKEIHLRPIPPKNVFERAVKKGVSYRKFSVRLADLDVKGEQFAGNKSLKGLVENLSSYEGVNIEVSISMGRSKKGLHNETVVETLHDLKNNSSLVSRVGVSIKDGEEPVEILDLFADKITDYIPIIYETRKTLSSQHAEDLMYKRYCESKPKILNSISKQ